MIKGSRKKRVIKALPYFREYMKENNITPTDLVDITGYSTTTISKFINGKPISKGVVQVISRELEVNQALISHVVDI